MLRPFKFLKYNEPLDETMHVIYFAFKTLPVIINNESTKVNWKKTKQKKTKKKKTYEPEHRKACEQHRRRSACTTASLTSALVDHSIDSIQSIKFLYTCKSEILRLNLDYVADQVGLFLTW